MAHSHDPTHHTHDGSSNERRLLATLALTGIFMVAEAVGGVLSGSLALIADAGHMLTDTAALGLAWLGFRIGRRSADADRTFGYERFEVLAGLVNGVVMFGVIAWIIWEAIARLAAPVEIHAAPMLAIATVGLGVNVLAFRILHGAQVGHVNIRGALLHVMGDLLGSIAAIMAALVILTTGWKTIDPLLSLGVAALLIRSSWTLVSHSAHILLEGTPAELDTAELTAELVERVPGVRDVHHVHVWSLTSGRHLATMHVRLEQGTDYEAVLATVKAFLEREWSLAHSTVQICPEECPDEPATGSDAPCEHLPQGSGSG